MYGSAKGKDIPETFIVNFEEREIDMKKIFSVATDGAPATMGQYRGSVTLVEQTIGLPVVEMHCILHLENLCAKISNSALNDVMPTATKIMNFLVARFATMH